MFWFCMPHHTIQAALHSFRIDVPAGGRTVILEECQRGHSVLCINKNILRTELGFPGDDAHAVCTGEPVGSVQLREPRTGLVCFVVTPPQHDTAGPPPVTLAILAHFCARLPIKRNGALVAVGIRPWGLPMGAALPTPATFFSALLTGPTS